MSAKIQQASDGSTSNQQLEIDRGYGDDNYSSVQAIQRFGFMDPMTGSVTQIVYNMLDINNADEAILECGCGTEYILPYLIQMKQPSCKLYLTDLSRTKLEVVAHKLEILESSPLSKDVYDYNYVPQQDQVKEYNKAHFNQKLNVYLQRIDASSLPYPNNKFNIYFGGLLLQELRNPFGAIKEAFRVLKKGGRVGFTLPDSLEDGEINEFDKLLAEAVANVTKTSPVFDNIQSDLLTASKVTNLLERAGFKNILVWNQFVPYNFFTKEDYGKHIELNDNNKLDYEIKLEALKIFEQKLRSSKTPFGLSILCIVGQKL